jgi:hypothetical protein
VLAGDGAGLQPNGSLLAWANLDGTLQLWKAG